MKILASLIILVMVTAAPATGRAAPCKSYEAVEAGDVSPCDGVRLPAAELDHLLTEETRAKELDTKLEMANVEIARLRAELKEARGIAEAERLARVAALANAADATKCYCDTPWGGWPWVTGVIGLGIGGVAGYGLREAVR